MRKLAIALALVAVPVTAAHAMSVATFLQKAEALQRRGALALLSSDFRLLKGEMTRAGEQLRAERAAAQAAGQRPAYCPPAERGGISPNEIINHMRSIPAAQRERLHVRDGLRGLLARRYPCPQG